MNECYLGIDIGSISTKGVIIDNDNNIRYIGKNPSNYAIFNNKVVRKLI